MNVGDQKRGLYEKYTIRRTDGTDAPGEKHEECEYFVLDLTHDEFAIPAIEAYARVSEKEYPLLAADLKRIAAAMKRKSRAAR